MSTQVSAQSLLPTPEALRQSLPASSVAVKGIRARRDEIRAIIHGESTKRLVIIGPCSIHDPIASLEYAKKLVHLQAQVDEQLLLVMRVYLEKPRTALGWPGFIHDPNQDGGREVLHGLTLARELLLQINALGIACATEFLDTITPQYNADLISWAAIGARSAESQTHRMLASGLSMPVGFKNNTAGDVLSAINGVLVARQPQQFLSVNHQGQGCVVSTQGNRDCHIVLRGGKHKPNYFREDILAAQSMLKQQALNPAIMIDCSHDNAQGDYQNQVRVLQDLMQHAQPIIMGVMLESFLKSGKQTVKPKQPLHYGQSITDACLGWEQTQDLILQLAASLNSTNIRAVKKNQQANCLAG